MMKNNKMKVTVCSSLVVVLLAVSAIHTTAAATESSRYERSRYQRKAVRGLQGADQMRTFWFTGGSSEQEAAAEIKEVDVFDGRTHVDDSSDSSDDDCNGKSGKTGKYGKSGKSGSGYGGKSGKSGKSGKAGPKVTCEPSVAPSETPSMSPMPSPSPSLGPTNEPSSSPSVSHSPTTSNVPTNVPTSTPSSPPTKSPTTSPSASPTTVPSAGPTSSPSLTPTNSPTASPSDQPSPLPSHTPTNYPTTSPSVHPTGVPTLSGAPSALPSLQPSGFPSSIPSSLPSVSAAPSTLLFNEIPVDEDGNPIDGGDNSTGGGGGINSECLEGPEDETGAVSAQYTFQYVMLLEPAGIANLAVMSVEPVMHRQLGLEFLKCEFNRRFLQEADGDEENIIELFELSSLPIDIVSADTCASDEVSDEDAGAGCYVVDAGFTAKMFLKGSEEEILQGFGDFLSKLMASGRLNDADPEIRRLAFRGFSNSDVVVDSTPDGDGGDPSGIAGSVQTDNNTGGIIGGSIAVAAAAIAVVVVLALIMKRKKRNQDYLKQVEQGSLYSIEIDTDSIDTGNASPTRALVLNEVDDQSSMSGMSNLIIEEGTEAWSHDVKNCFSSTCHICQAARLQMPTFIPAELMAAEIQRDLGPNREEASRREYPAQDTVDL